MKLSAIFMDFDGVIAETMPFHLPAWEVVLAHECGFLPDRQMIRLNEGQPIFCMARKIFEHAGVAYTEELLDEIIKKKNQFFLKSQQAMVYSQVYDIIDKLQTTNIKLGLVTGTARSNLNRIVKQELLDSFNVIVTGESTQQGKPAPDPYNAAAYALNLQHEHNHCLVIENAPLGIKSAKAAGMMCYAIETTLPKNELAQADIVFSDHNTLLTHLDEMLT